MISKILKATIAGVLLVTSVSAAHAQDESIKLSPIGRFLVDGAAYVSDDHDDFKAGVAIPELRLGMRGSYQMFQAKAEIGYAYGKITLKDVYLQAMFKPNLSLFVGNMITPYGVQSAYNASMKSTMEMPVSNAAFNMSRSIGVKGLWYDKRCYSALTLCAESKASLLHANEMGQTGWGGVVRLAYLPLNKPGRIVEVGWSGALLGAQHNEVESLNHSSVSFSANFPTQVSRVTALSATVPDAGHLFKFTPELLASYGRVAFESQYYYNRVARKNGLPAYTAYGAYAIVRAQLRGSDYTYLNSDARFNTPDPKSLELVGAYNYTCLDDNAAGIRGGRLSEVSLTFNWYINRYIIWRLRAGYTHAWGRTGIEAVDLGAFQTRIQIIF